MRNSFAVLVSLLLLNALAAFAISSTELKYVGRQICRQRPNSAPTDKVDSKPKPGSIYLQIYAAGANGEAGPILKSSDKFCPKSYSSGFSIFCKGVAESTKEATFIVNGKEVRTETNLPYAIAGDYKGNARPWTRYPREATIKCVTDTEDSTDVKIRFEC